MASSTWLRPPRRQAELFGYEDPPGFQVIHQHLASVSRQGKGENVGRAASQDLGLGYGGPDGVGAVLPQGGHPGQGLLMAKLSHPGGLSEGGDLRHGLRAGTQPSLLPASQDVGGELYSLADVQGADSLGRVDFVPADGQKIHSQPPGREGELQISLDGVGMQQGGAAPGSEQPGNAGQIRHRPGFVVYQHQGDQHRILPQSRLHGGYRHGPRGVGGGGR